MGRPTLSTLAPIPPIRIAEPPAEPPAPVRSEPAERSAAVPDAPANPNPRLRLDPALGLVVMELRDLQGHIETVPTERELAAYRAGLQRPGPAAPGHPVEGPPTPGGTGKAGR